MSQNHQLSTNSKVFKPKNTQQNQTNKPMPQQDNQRQHRQQEQNHENQHPEIKGFRNEGMQCFFISVVQNFRHCHQESFRQIVKELRTSNNQVARSFADNLEKPSVLTDVLNSLDFGCSISSGFDPFKAYLILLEWLVKQYADIYSHFQIDLEVSKYFKQFRQQNLKTNMPYVVFVANANISNFGQSQFDEMFAKEFQEKHIRRCTQILKLPKNIVVMIQYQYLAEKGLFSGNIDFTMDPIVTIGEGEQTKQYELSGYVPSTSYHSFAYCKNINDEWYEFNDSSTKKANFGSKNIRTRKVVTLLFYREIATLKDEKCILDKKENETITKDNAPNDSLTFIKKEKKKETEKQSQKVQSLSNDKIKEDSKNRQSKNKMRVDNIPQPSTLDQKKKIKDEPKKEENLPTNGEIDKPKRKHTLKLSKGVCIALGMGVLIPLSIYYFFKDTSVVQKVEI